MLDVPLQHPLAHCKNVSPASAHADAGETDYCQKAAFPCFRLRIKPSSRNAQKGYLRNREITIETLYFFAVYLSLNSSFDEDKKSIAEMIPQVAVSNNP